jgi:hypothetical protein
MNLLPKLSGVAQFVLNNTQIKDLPINVVARDNKSLLDFFGNNPNYSNCSITHSQRYSLDDLMLN